ncbi:MAG: [FeFe] hydrogenase, group A [Bacteriovoracaceae bacterium]|nr:[FeFe] hydrogenase, group A [Bacteriovoracaceae bacterium]
MINLTINGEAIQVEANATILTAAKKLGIKIPTLCHMDLECFGKESRVGSCRICVVEVEGRNNLAPSCCTPVNEGMVVKTDTIKAIKARRTVLELILSDHPNECLTCAQSMDCELQALAREMGVFKIEYAGEQSTYPLDISNNAIIRDLNKCIMCRRCETMCTEVQTVGILSGVGRGFNAVVAPTLGKPLSETKCTFCGQCVSVCPVGALSEYSCTRKVWDEINDDEKFVIVQTAPAVRVALGEEFGMDPGTIVTGKMTAALNKLGFDKVFDTDWAADLTIMEEGAELIKRVKSGENLPIVTSCCPGWVKFFEHQFPDLLNLPSTAKSPHQMLGAMAKTYLADIMGIDPKKIVVVSVMPCLAKKYEADRPELSNDGMQDVDYVLSTRELAAMIKEAGIPFTKLEDQEFDPIMGESTGAGVIFASSGGVLEAALRTVADVLSGEDLPKFDYEAVRGLEGVREATVNVAGMDVKVAVTSSLGNARLVLEKIRKGELDIQALEIMACPGGCINGGGQPYTHNDTTIIEKRMDAIYREDAGKPLRKSHKNPEIIKIYKDFLGEPCGEKSHELLHTSYEKRDWE